MSKTSFYGFDIQSSHPGHNSLSQDIDSVLGTAQDFGSYLYRKLKPSDARYTKEYPHASPSYGELLSLAGILFGGLGIGTGAIPTYVPGPSQNIFQSILSPYDTSQAAELSSAEAFNLIPSYWSRYLAARQVLKYHLGRRYPDLTGSSKRPYFVRKALTQRYKSLITSYLDMKRRRPSKTARRGTYPGTLKSDGQFRYGLGRLGRKALFKMPLFDCSPEDEIKWVDYQATITKSAGSQILIPITSLCVMDRGTSSSTRVGQRTKIHAFDIRVSNLHGTDNDPGATGPAEHGSQAHVIELWYDAQCNGSAATATGLYTANAFRVHYNMDNTSRYFPVWSTPILPWTMKHVPDTGVSDDRVFITGIPTHEFIPVPSTCIEYTVRS